MKKTNKKRGAGLAERLMRDHDVPPELLCGGCFMEFHGRCRLIVRGCRRVVKYSPENVVLRVYKNAVSIAGVRLTCISYLAGAVAVEGYINSVSFVGNSEADNEA